MSSTDSAPVFEDGPYQFRRLLGEGGFGEVYEAWDNKLCRSIAIKRLKSHVLAGVPRDLLEEARMAASLNHAAFVKIFSVDGNADERSIVMEYVEGATLRQAVQQSPMAPSAALDIVAQVADGMQQAHASRLIHGDIKPSNLMLEPSGKVRIMDFGLARRIDPQATGSLGGLDPEGTVAYLAPELLLGGAPSEQSDIYALGVVLYELINGSRPFQHLQGLALAAAQLQTSSAQWPFIPGIPPAVCALVRAMTARERAERMDSMVAVRTAALAAMHGQVVALPAPPRKRLAIGWKKPALAALAAAALIGGGLAAFRYDWQGAGSPLFSESTAMRVGMEALKTYDRDYSIDTAIKQFQALLAHNPNHAGAAAGLALAYCYRYQIEGRDEAVLKQADASAQLAVKADDQLALGYAALARVRGLQGKYDDGLALAERALGLNPRSLEALYIKAELLWRSGRNDAAEAANAAGAAAYPKERMFVDLLGAMRYKQGKYDEAEAAFRRSIALEPDASAAYGSLSAALQYLNRSDEALQVLQQGLQIRPNGVLYTNLGNALFNRGDYLGAATAFERALSSARGNRQTYLRWANLGDALRWIPGRDRDALNAYREASALAQPLLERSVDDPTLNSRLGLYAARLGQRDKAARLSAHALSLAAKNAEVHFRAAMAYELIGERDTAVAELNQAQMLGYPAKLIGSEPDLMALRRDPRYHTN